MLKNDPNNHTCFAFLKALKETYVRISLPMDSDLSTWIACQRLMIIEGLKKPAKEDGSMFIEIVREQGNIAMLYETHVSLLCTIKPILTHCVESYRNLKKSVNRRSCVLSQLRFIEKV
jgi:hypothetical protein